MKRTLLSTCIILCMVFCLIPTSLVFAEEGTGSNIRLSYSDLLLYPDDYDVRITLQGNYNQSNIKKIEAYTDDANIATVNWMSGRNYGTVYGDSLGSTQLTVKVYENYTDSYDWVTTLKCNIYVGKKPSFELKEYLLSPDEVSHELLFYDYPEGIECTFSSSDESVATVNQDGFVTPRNEGTCKLYAKLGQKTISTNVTVQWMPNYKAKIIKIDKKKGTVKVKYSNIGKRSIKIYNKNATLWYKNGKKGRLLKAKSVTIKSGQTKTITYKNREAKIKGSMKGAYVYHQVIFDGEKMNAWVYKKYSTIKYWDAYWETYYDMRY